MNLPQSQAATNIFRPAQFELAHPNIFDRPGPTGSVASL